jgi:aspartyl-tRNA(Asn)/glutamyl-tRNA(Gln) amidotransferase subunit A
VGFKPTYGRVSRSGLVAFASSMDQIGPLTTTIADSCLMMEVIGKKCMRDSTCLNLPQENYLEKIPSSLKGMKVGVSWPFMKDLKEDIKQNFTHSLNVLQTLGAEIVNVDLETLKYSLPVYYILAPAEASTNLARFDGIRFGKRSKKAQTLDEIYDLSRDEGFGEEVKRRILLGTFVLSSGYIDAYYKKAQKVRTLIINTFDNAFSDCHLIAMPTAPSTAFAVGAVHDPLEMYLQDIFTIPANLAGLPAVSIPSGFDHEHKPYGLQLLGPQLHDVFVLGAAHLFESASGFSGRKVPSLFDKEVV